MARKTFINWLLSPDKKPLYVEDTTGHIVEADAATWKKPDGQPAKLFHDPTGWKEMLVKYARNTKYWGLFRDMTVPMNFAGDGATILRHEMWNYGSEVENWFAVHKLDRLSFPYQYKPWYVCELDYTKFKQSSSTVSINAMEGGLSKILKANEGITYEIDVSNDPEAINILNDGIPFTNKVSYTIYSDQPVIGSFDYTGMGVTATEGSSQGILNQDQENKTTSSYPNEDWFMNSVNKTITAKIRGTINVHCNTSGNILIRLEKTNKDTPGTITNYIIHNAAGTAGLNYTFGINHDIPLGPNDRLYLKQFTPVSGSGVTWYTVTGGELTVDYEVRFTESYCKALRPYRLFEKLVEKMTDGKYGVQSSFLNTQEMMDMPLTSAQNIRNFTATDGIIKTSLNDFYQSHKRFGVGIGILKDIINGDKLIMEKFDYFFRSDLTVVNLGEVNNLEAYKADDICFNTIQSGNKNQEYDKVNGRDEFNVTQLWQAPVTREVSKLDLVSVYRDDMYGIELLRVDLYKKDTTDNKSDNDVFRMNIESAETIGTMQYYAGEFECQVVSGTYFIKIPSVLFQLANTSQFTIAGAVSNNGTYTVLNTSYLVVGYTIIQVAEVLTAATVTGTLSVANFHYYKLYRPAYTAISGLLHPAESYNIELSPHTAVLKNGRFIRSVLDFKDVEKLKFQTGEKNSELSRTIGGVTITEKEDIPIGGLGDKLFRPYYFSFTTKVPIDYLELINSNPYGLIYFTYKGVSYNGFMWDGGIKPGNNDKQQWQLLCGPNVDLKKLIDNV